MVAAQMYHSYELETLEVVESIKRFRVYLIAFLKRDFLSRWWLAVQEYDMEVEYRVTKSMKHVDV